MRPKSLTFSKTSDLGNSHETISVTLEIKGGETAQDAIHLARKFVNHNLERGPDPDLAKARAILEDRDSNTGRDVKWAEQFIAALPPVDNKPIL